MDKHVFAVCAYKESPYLEECIQSLLAQSRPSRVIVCTSTKNAYITAVCEKYGLPLYENKGTGGIDGDWNDALNAADAEYVTLCHQDDVYEQRYAEQIKKAIAAYDDHLILLTDYFELRNNEKCAGSRMLSIKRLLLWPLKPKVLQNRRFFKRMALRFGNPVCCPSVTYHKTVLPMPLFEKRFKSNLDWQTWEKLSCMEGRFGYINERLMCHRLHADSTTSELIRDNLRTGEDESVFSLFWPKPVARILAKVYALSERENES